MEDEFHEMDDLPTHVEPEEEDPDPDPEGDYETSFIENDPEGDFPEQQPGLKQSVRY